MKRTVVLSSLVASGLVIMMTAAPQRPQAQAAIS